MAMVRSEHHHLLGRERGTVLGHFTARHERNARTEAVFEAPGRYNLRAAPSAELAASAGQPTSSFSFRGPRIAKARLAATSTAEELSLEHESDPWHKRNNTRLAGGFMSSLGRAEAHRANRAGMARDFRDPDNARNPKMAEFEARRAFASRKADNFLTTPTGCFAHGRWMSGDERSAAERQRDAAAAMPHFRVPLGAPSGEAALRPEDEGEGATAAVAEAIARREARARALEREGGQTQRSAALVGWRTAQQDAAGGGEGGASNAGWAKSEHGMTPALRRLMFSY